MNEQELLNVKWNGQMDPCGIEKKTRLKNTHVPKTNNKIAERGNIDTPNTHTHDWSFFWNDKAFQ